MGGGLSLPNNNKAKIYQESTSAVSSSSSNTNNTNTNTNTNNKNITLINTNQNSTVLPTSTPTLNSSNSSKKMSSFNSSTTTNGIVDISSLSLPLAFPPLNLDQRKLPKTWEEVVWPYMDRSNPSSSNYDSSYDFNSWNFNVFNFANDDLILLTSIILKQYNIHSIYSLNLQIWYSFLIIIENLMVKYNNPYHNFYHIIDVFISIHIFLNFNELHYFQINDIFLLFLSSLCHDLEHPGLNNSYHINSKSDLAVRYNDVSVLENFHAARTFEIFYKKNSSTTGEDNYLFNFLDIIESKHGLKKNSLRSQMISLILATDMTFHFSLKEDLDKNYQDFLTMSPDYFYEQNELLNLDVLHKNSEEKSDEKDEKQLKKAEKLKFFTVYQNIIAKNDEKKKILLLKSILHACDISNPCKTISLSRRWTDNINNEFFRQGDLEKTTLLPVSFGCDRNSVNIDENSLNFIDFIVAPFYFSLTYWIPRSFHTTIKTLIENRSIIHEELMERLKKINSPEDNVQKWIERRDLFSKKVNELQEKLHDFL